MVLRPQRIFSISGYRKVHAKRGKSLASVSTLPWFKEASEASHGSRRVAPRLGGLTVASF
jgi:hypothetical protein